MGRDKSSSQKNSKWLIPILYLKTVEPNSPLLDYGLGSDSLPKSAVCKEAVGGGVRETEFTVDKPGKHYLSQVSKVNTNSDNSC